MKAIHYFETGSTNPYYNLAFEEYILTHRMEGSILLLWQNDNTIVIGQNQNTSAEINASFVKQHSINVVRRTTGGGAVYHDLGNLNYSFIADVDNIETLSYEQFTKPIVMALKNLGLNASASGRNDILIDDKKISGSAQRVYKTRVLHHGTLLFDSNSDMISGALNVDPAKFIGKASQSVRQRVGNIRNFLKEDMTIDEFWDYLKTYLLKNDYILDEIDSIENKNIEALKEKKYQSWEWNFGKSPKYQTSNRKACSGGIIEATFTVNKGILSEIEFFGDFLSRKPLDKVYDALIGCTYKNEDILKALNSIPDIEDYFGQICVNDIAELILS